MKQALCQYLSAYKRGASSRANSGWGDSSLVSVDFLALTLKFLWEEQISDFNYVLSL